MYKGDIFIRPFFNIGTNRKPQSLELDNYVFGL